MITIKRLNMQLNMRKIINHKCSFRPFTKLSCFHKSFGKFHVYCDGGEPITWTIPHLYLYKHNVGIGLEITWLGRQFFLERRFK